MGQIISPPENVGEMPSLSMQALGSLRQGLEEAIAMCLRGEGQQIRISVYDREVGEEYPILPIKEWIERRS